MNAGMEIKQIDTIAELGAMRPFLKMITDCGIAAFRKEIQAQTSKLEYVYWAYRGEVCGDVVGLGGWGYEIDENTAQVTVTTPAGKKYSTQTETVYERPF